MLQIDRVLTWGALLGIGISTAAGCGGDRAEYGPRQITVVNDVPASPTWPGGHLDWLAFQDGDGDWTTVQGADGRYTFEVAKGRYAVATVCAPFAGDISRLFVAATVTEFSETIVPCPRTTPGPPVQLSLVFHGLEEGQTLDLAISGKPRIIRRAPIPSHVSWLKSGVYDIAALVSEGDAEEPVRAIVMRDVDLQTDRELVLDFAEQAIELENRTVEYVGRVPTDDVQAYSLFYTARGATLHLSASGRIARFIDYRVLPDAALVPSDGHELHVAAAESTEGVHRGVVKGLGTPTTVIQLPPSVGPIPVSAEMMAPLRPTVDLSRVKTSDFHSMTIFELSPLEISTWKVVVTRNWLRGADTFTLPDFGSLPDFKPEWSWRPVNKRFSVRAVKSSRGVSEFLVFDPETAGTATQTYAGYSGLLPP